MIHLDDFFWFALLGGVGVAITAGPLGCFVVWRRMAYFGDSLAHSALIGVALGLALSIDTTLGVLIGCVAFAVIITLLQDQNRLATDTLLGILAHSSLALGLVAVSFQDNVRIDLMAYLFGDILAIDVTDLAWVYGGGTVALLGLAYIWRPLLALSVHADIARAEGIPVRAVRLAFTLLLAIVIAIAMKIVGVLLIVSMLIIPAATARRFAKSPEQMAFLAATVGAVAVIIGLAASLQWNTPSGPSIVSAAFALFLLGNAAGAAFNRA
ncbi:MAG: iron chelate uptake ABC transporter family permease subunit [Rhodospirillaceae bacterium]|jgi:zinc transport system permease protein|nr:iron chelate uptake ABC transporter family permease subunit [Rhodospirillaceae bacterium]MBT5664403.1 iron chelate uptake ABC transporter family permease subunit [Rhodospirillaceae bacterium]